MRRNAWRTIATLMVGALAALIPLLAPSVATPAAAYPAGVCASLQVSTTTPRVGEAITVTGVHFNPNSNVTLVLKRGASNTTADNTVYTLKTVRSDASGAFTTQVTMPAATTSKGNFDIYATTGAPKDSTCPADPRVDVTLSAAGTTDTSNPGTTDTNTNGAPGATAFTGVNVLILVLIAAGLITVGAVITRRGKATGTSR